MRGFLSSNNLEKIMAFDYRNYTCTDLTIKFKILLRKLDHNQEIEFLVTRDGADTIRGPLRKSKHHSQIIELSQNEYKVIIVGC